MSAVKYTGATVRSLLSLAVLLLVFIFGFSFLQTGTVDAATKQKASQEQQDIYLKKICVAAKKKGAPACKKYKTQAELDKAVKSLCNNKKYKSSTKSSCAAYKAATPTCSNGVCSSKSADPDAACVKHDCDLIKKYVNPIINLLSVSFGLIAAGSLIYGGIQYSSSGGDPQKTAQAKQRFFNTIGAIFMYLFLYSFLQFLIPGGIF